MQDPKAKLDPNSSVDSSEYRCLSNSKIPAKNLHSEIFSIDRTSRERLNGHQGKVVWLTGLSGSGKSTLANALEVDLHRNGVRTYLLDGDNMRLGLNSDLGFTEADRIENTRRLAEVANLMQDAGLVAICASISPFRQAREAARLLIGVSHFVEVFLDVPLAICEKRDPKGLYKKARLGNISNMSGVSSPYEPPVQPDVRVDANTPTNIAVMMIKHCLAVENRSNLSPISLDEM